MTTPPQPYTPGQMTPPTPRRKSNTGLIIGIVAAVFAVLCLGGGLIAALASNPDNTDAADEQAQTTEAPASQVHQVGQPVRGGDFQFVVHGQKCGIAQVGDEYLNRKAQGSFCRIDISVKNVTKSAHLFHADSIVKAKDTSGREFSSDGEANIYGNKDGAGFLNEINPGNQVRAFVYFDVPTGAKLTTITFDAGLLTLAEDAVVTL